MKAFETLPEGYKEYYAIDLQKNKKISLLINLLAIAIAAVFVVPMLYIVPISTVLAADGYWTRFIALIVLMIVYMILHELVHGAAMKLCGTKKVTYGFTGMYAFAGSQDYYAKKPYIFIALAPVVLWGIVLLIVNLIVPVAWFWIVYILQIINLSGAAGDLFVTVKFSRFPKDILIKDHGVGMTVYTKENG